VLVGTQAGTARATAVVVTWNSTGLLGDLVRTLEGLAGTTSVIVVDNCSSDGTPEVLADLPWIRLIRSPRNGGFGYGSNIGLRHVRTPYALLLNSDASLRARDVMAMADFLDRHPSFAGVQPVLRAWDWPEVTAGRGMGFNSLMEAFDLGFLRFEPILSSPVPVEVAGVGAAAALLRMSALRECGEFDERYFMYFEDADLMVRLGAAGWKFAVHRGLEGRHRIGSSSRRSRAGSWEVASSLLLARKLGVPMYRRRASREARIWAFGARRMRPPLWRVPGLARGLLTHVVRMKGMNLPPSSPPMEEPQPRPPAPFPADGACLLGTGPGWVPGRDRVFRGYCSLLADRGGLLTALMQARSGTHTARVWQGREPGEPFAVTTSPSAVKTEVGPGRVYIALDDRAGMPAVRMMELRLDP